MNKTININLGGIFFHIDENAFQKLKKYLDTIARSLSDDPQGKNEIIADIELRISELLSEKIKDARQVISESDIDEVIAIMGQPEDYVDTEEGNGTYIHKRTSKKLYRDGDDKFIGGVASGLAHYIGIDPIWMRLLWLVLIFGAGIGFLLYIILWILVPEAKTTSEKLEMEGEAVNIGNIEKKIKKEFEDVSDRIKTGDYTKKAKSGFQDFIDTLGKIFTALFKVAGKFIGVLLIIISASTLIGLIVGGFSLGSLEFLGLSDEFANYPPFFYDSSLPIWLLTIFLFVAVGVPFMILFVLGLRILSSNTRRFGKTTSLTLLGIWIIAILGLIFSGIEFATVRAYDGANTIKQELVLAPTDTINVKMIGNDDLTVRKYLRRRYTKEITYVNDNKKLYSTLVKLDIRKSNNNTAYVKIRKEAEGKTRLDANENAQNINYNFSLVDKDLQLDGYFISDIKNRYRSQEIEVTIYLPERMNIYFDNSTKTYLNNVANTQNIYDGDMVNHYFNMTHEGLKCLDCSSDLYRE